MNSFKKWARKYDLKGWCFIIGSMSVVALVCIILQLFINSFDGVRAKEPTPDELNTISKTVVEKPTERYISLGEFMVTAYCSCYECCGYWATIRPIDENGKAIVYTANQSVAEQGVTVAADISVLPYGTEISVDGHEYIVQDRGGAIKGKHIDVYFEDHEEAKIHGVQYKEIFMKVTR